jgi:hypothetical protein
MVAYPNQTPTLGSLNFEEIKESLKNYLKNQDNLRDFNFEGSVMQTILNALAYNTYYYAFYANMVANETFLDSAQRIDSIISLSKPLGYFVPLKSSSKAVINVFGLLDDIPEYAHFYGVDSDGIIYSFYTISSYQAVDSDALNVEIYEGKRIYTDLNVTNRFDFVKQRFFINDPDIDVNTLKVKVQLDGLNNPANTKDPWVLADTLGNTTTANQNVYYLERVNNGVYVLFGKTNSLGNSIADGSDQVFIDYLASSGSAANGIVAFSFVSPTEIAGNLNIGLLKASSGGLDEPNLDFVKFIAPRAFASQNRAVTKDDIKALIAPFFTSPSEFNVFGGDETFPRMYGRVFFTADLDPTQEGDLQKIQQIYNVLRTKCVVTVIPEFTLPKQRDVRNDVNYRLATNRTYSQSEQQAIRNGIKALMNNNYDSDGQYNFTFNAVDAIAEIQSTYPDVIIEPSDFSFTYTETFTEDGPLSLNLENELDIPLYTDFEITGEYKNKLNQTIKLVAFIQAGQNQFEFINLKTLLKSGNNFLVSTEVNGRINIKRGVIEIYDNRLSGTPVTVSVPFKNSYFISNVNNKFRFRTSSVELK